MGEPLNGPKLWPVEAGEGQPAATGGRQVNGPRLPRLNSRVRRSKQRKVKECRFSEGPPSLADTVCLATLEANQARPQRYLSVSSHAWPEVRIEQRWAEVLTAWLIFLGDLVPEGEAKLEAKATRVPEARGVELELRVRHPGVPRQPEQFDCSLLGKALDTMRELEGTAQLAVEYPEVCVTLQVPDARNVTNRPQSGPI